MSVSEQAAPKAEQPAQQSQSRSTATTLRNGFIGGVVALLLSFLPLSTLLSGGIAGYLDRKAGQQGVKAGAMAGGITVIPYLLVGLYLALSPALPFSGPMLSLPPGLVVTSVVVIAVIYAVGLSILGSLIGAAIYQS